MQTRKLGRQGLEVSSIGFGAMGIGIADVYSSSVRDDAAAIALIQRSIDGGRPSSTRPTSTATRSGRSAWR